MNASKIKSFFSNLPFRKALWLGPLAYVCHQIEEWAFNFRAWRLKYFGMELKIGFWEFFFILLAIDVAFIILHNFWPNRVTAIVVLIIILATQFYNGIYHLYWTIYFGVYSPGVVTGLLIFVPISCFLIFKAFKENYIDKLSGVIIIILSGLMFWCFNYIGFIFVVICLITIVIILIIYYIISQRTLKK